MGPHTINNTCGSLPSCPLSCPNLLCPVNGSGLLLLAYKIAQDMVGTPQISTREVTGCRGGKSQAPIPNTREADISTEKAARCRHPNLLLQQMCVVLLCWAGLRLSPLAVLPQMSMFAPKAGRVTCARRTL